MFYFFSNLLLHKLFISNSFLLAMLLLLITIRSILELFNVCWQSLDLVCTIDDFNNG